MPFSSEPSRSSPATSHLVRSDQYGLRALWLVLGLAVVAAGVLAATRKAWLEPMRAALHGDAGRVAQELASRLRAEAPGLASVDASGAEVTLLGGRVRLLVRQEVADGADVHVHVTAILAADTPGRPDACVMGNGHDHSGAVAEAAEAYRTRVLPAILGLASSDATNAQPFGGTEPWGVPGFRGFVGPLVSQGEIPDAVADALQAAPLLDGFTRPGDGRAHLLKVVLLANEGAWQRWLELDGVGTPVNGETWRGAPAPPSTAMVVRYAAFQKRDRQAQPEARGEGLRRIVAGEAEALERGRCPLTLVPARLSSVAYTSSFCRGGRLLDCAEECDAGSGIACYHAALEVQSQPATEPRAQALFLRGCRLGVASACTNAAAGLDAAQAPTTATSATCTVRTYEQTCERAGDRWGCTMYGSALLEGRGVPRDTARARAVLGEACRGDQGDPACAAARQMLRYLDVATPRGERRP